MGLHAPDTQGAKATLPEMVEAVRLHACGLEAHEHAMGECYPGRKANPERVKLASTFRAVQRLLEMIEDNEAAVRAALAGK
jgi:hypothetical protein